MALFLRPLVAPVSPKALMHDCDPIGSLGSDGNINSSLCREPQRSPATPPRQAHVLAPSTSPTPSTPADGPRPHASHIKQHHAPSATPLRRSSTSDEDRSSAIQRPPSRQLGGPCVSWHRCREAAACIGRVSAWDCAWCKGGWRHQRCTHPCVRATTVVRVLQACPKCVLHMQTLVWSRHDRPSCMHALDMHAAYTFEPVPFPQEAQAFITTRPHAPTFTTLYPNTQSAIRCTNTQYARSHLACALPLPQ